MNEIDVNLQIGVLAQIYKMQLETKRVYEMMPIGVEFTARNLQKITNTSLQSLHNYANNMLKLGLIEKKIIKPKGYKIAIYKRISTAEYETMNFNATVTKIRNSRERKIVMPEFPAALLNMMGYTEFKPPKGRVIEESMPHIPVSKHRVYVAGSTLEMV